MGFTVYILRSIRKKSNTAEWLSGTGGTDSFTVDDMVGVDPDAVNVEFLCSCPKWRFSVL